MKEGKKRGSGYSIASNVLLLAALLIPFVFSRISTKYYYLFATLMLVIILAAFVLAFEKGKPGAGEIVTIAVMSALAVASRCAFVWIPHFKPMAGIIMITGAALGAQAGFLTGAAAVLVSNFYFGQGAWTLWQIIAFGLGGYVYGLLFRKQGLRKPVIMALLGFLFVVLILGPILDTSTLFLANFGFGRAALAVYASGLPVNLVHGAATFITILLFSKPLIEKLERVKLKYGWMGE